MTFPAYGSLPGMYSGNETSEKVVWFGRQEHNSYGEQAVIGSTAVDAGNSPTTTLRAGLLLGRITATNKLVQFDPTATDGTQFWEAVLLRDISMLNAAGTAEDKYGHVLLRGGLKIADLLILGAAFSGHAGEHQARRQANGRFWLDDDIDNAMQGTGLRTQRHATDYTVLTTDSGKLMIATAAVTFTLPTIRAGMVFDFLQTADANMIVNGGASSIISVNSVAGTSVTFSTSSQKIGAHARFEAIYTGASTLKWLYTLQSTGATGVVA